MLKLIILGAFLTSCYGSLFCPHTVIPSAKDNFRTMIMQVKEREGQQPMYRIVDNETTDLSFKSASEKFKLLTRMDNSECPGRSCVTELSAAMPRHQGSILYLTNIVGKLIPPGFTTIEVKNRLYCAIIEGDCGATIPIYRYFKFTMGGLYHAYSTDSADIPGFTMESSPLCYAWPVEKQYDENVPSKPSNINLTPEEKYEIKNEVLQMISLNCSSKSKKSPRESMKPLNVWKNGKTGPFADHWYTTKKPTKGYEYDETIGLVVVDEKKSNCGCLVRLTQMVDDKPDGIWARTDHKLIIDYKEPQPNAGEEYTNVEEEIFCVKEEGVCGATVALRKFFKLGEMDTVYTVNDATIPTFSIPSPAGVLCYIWPAGKNDLPNESEKRIGQVTEVKEEEKVLKEKSKPQTSEEMKNEEAEQKMEMKPIKEDKKSENKDDSEKSEGKEKQTSEKTESKKSENKESSKKSEAKMEKVSETKKSDDKMSEKSEAKKSETSEKVESKKTDDKQVSEKVESKKSEAKEEKASESKKSDVKVSEKLESKKPEAKESKKTEVEKKKDSKKDEEKKPKKVESSTKVPEVVKTEKQKDETKTSESSKTVKSETTTKVPEVSTTEKAPEVASTEKPSESTTVATVESSTKSEEKSTTEKPVEKVETTTKAEEKSTKKVEESTSSSSAPSTESSTTPATSPSTESTTASSTEQPTSSTVVSSTESKSSSTTSESTTETAKKQ